MRFVQTAIGLLLLSVPVGACTIFDARSDCENNPWGCAGEMGNGGTTTSSSPSCDDGEQNGDELAVDCGGSCGACEVVPCKSSDDCVNMACVDGFCCDTLCDGLCMGCAAALTGEVDGFCAPLKLGTSGPEDQECSGKGGCGAAPGFCRCDDGTKNGDETDVDCGGECGGTCTIGLGCATGDDCASSNPCVDGVCCNNDCNLECGSCNLPDLLGLCSALIGEDASMCSGAAQCNADQTCLKAKGQTCASAGQCASGLCSGSPAKCAACDANVMCPPAKSCLAGVCVSNGLGNGTTCVDGVQCASAHCVDGVCCDQKCDGFCMGCHQSYTDTNSGTCAQISKGLDPHNECSGPGAGATCSGAVVNGASACGENPLQQ